nr:tetratricopeptide repeat protein [uncultured Flavobacterium sp.]
MIRFLIFCFITTISFAQVNPEEADLAINELENNFYEALKQKSIENYDKAIISLEKCLEKDPKNAEVYYQLGTNFLAQKKYLDAEQNFQKAIDITPNQRWYWNGLYDVYYQTRAYEKAIPIVEKLVVFDINMKEDLASLYMNTNQFEKAKKVIDDIENTTNLSKTMELYKMQIQAMQRQSKPQVETLVQAIVDFPKVEQNYLDLIYAYSVANQEDKAFEIAKKLAVELPTSDMAHVSLVKFYIAQKNTELATESFKRVSKSAKIDSKIKHRVLNEFLIFATQNTSLYNEIDQVLVYFTNDSGLDVYKELGKFFYKKEQYLLAEKYLEKAQLNPEMMDLLLNVYDFNQSFDKMAKSATQWIDLYPTKANLYYYAAKATNKLKKFKQAKEFLDLGMDYVVEDKNLEAGFYKQYMFAADGLSDQKLKQDFQKKLDQINTK